MNEGELDEDTTVELTAIDDSVDRSIETEN